MGKSAKVHKRISKQGKNSTSRVDGPTQVVPSMSHSAKAAKKRSAFKGKLKSVPSGAGGLLGGADYLALMMGGRRKAADEAKKLPQTQTP